MLRFPSESVDLILADPPYNISRYSTGNIPRAGKTTLNNEIADWDKILVKPDEYVDVFKRIIKPAGNIIIFSGYNQIGEWHKVFDPAFDTFQIFVWHKTNPAQRYIVMVSVIAANLLFFYGIEGIYGIFPHKKKCIISMSAPICSYPERLKSPFHPTQKPIQLLEHFIK